MQQLGLVVLLLHGGHAYSLSAISTRASAPRPALQHHLAASVSVPPARTTVACCGRAARARDVAMCVNADDLPTWRALAAAVEAPRDGGSAPRAAVATFYRDEDGWCMSCAQVCTRAQLPSLTPNR